MMDNEQPRQPPEQPKNHITPKVTSQVPEVTLFSPANKLPAINRPNFLQRVIAGDKVSIVQQPPPLIVPQVPTTNHQNYGNSLPAKPSVPDLSLFEPQVLKPVNQRRPSSSPSNQIYQKPAQASKENLFDLVGKHAVPDVTILEDPQQQRPKPGSSNTVFDESYKNMLMNTHNAFMKQFKADNPPTPSETTAAATKRSGFFGPQSAKYQENPLLKYAPKPKAAVTCNTSEPDLSSVLRAFETESELMPDTDEKVDEITFKKVAAMLSEIQKLVITDKTTPEGTSEASSMKKAPRRSEILRRLAFQYLTPEEMREYDVEDELKDLEKDESEDSS